MDKENEHFNDCAFVYGTNGEDAFKYVPGIFLKLLVAEAQTAVVLVDLEYFRLIHVSEMSWSQHLRSAQEFLKIGDEIEAVILTLDRNDRKMSLGIKQLKSDPWENIDTKYPIGSPITLKLSFSSTLAWLPSSLARCLGVAKPSTP